MRYLILLTALLCFNTSAFAFCGFYVAKADAKLFNKSSQVILVRDGNHTVITMSNDFQGSVKDFAMVVPVPEVLEESDIRVVQQHVFDKFDAYTAPRMVEYWDRNPCQVYAKSYARSSVKKSMSRMQMDDGMAEERNKDLGVTVEATYTVGEYDILILSAKESDGLKTWLTESGYKIPANAEEVLQPYINDGMKFFVVKVNLEEQSKSGYTALRPLQIQFNSDRFMLPIRLGMANSSSTQDLIVYAFTRNGRVETANYRTTKLPTDREIPTFVKKKNLFGEFYKATFDKAWKNEGKNSVMLEYAWNITGSNPVKCDPCNTPLVTFAELREAGVWWLQANMNNGGYTGELFVTRLHLRYGREKFPQDLAFINTPNRENFQGRYVVRHPATGSMTCSEGRKYKKGLEMRKQKELQELAALTGWNTSQYNWYLGDAGAPEEKIEPLRTLPEAPGELMGAVEEETGEASTTSPAVNEGGEMDGPIEKSEADELLAEEANEAEGFLDRARLQAAEASTPVNNNWLLLLVAGGVFVLGIALRTRIRKE